MKLFTDCLPQQPSREQSRELIQNAPLSFWLPVLHTLQDRFHLGKGQWTRIPQGANALFGLGEEVIVKLVPPNWQQQGEKELLVAPLLDGKLSLRTPHLIGGGFIDDWLFVISGRLAGCSLADCWPSMAIDQKRSIMQQVGQLMRELRTVAFDEASAIQVDWQDYIRGLIASCLARHQRCNMPAALFAQVMPYLEAAGDFAQAGETRFIHMDIHPWNLMAQQEGGHWRLTGLLDFGDAIVGNSDRFEIITPMIFMAQGDPILVHALIDSYGLLGQYDVSTLQHHLMAHTLIRPDSDVGFGMQQVPPNGPRDTWQQIAGQMFPV